MTRPPTRKEITHERIVDAASRALRKYGYAGVAVAEVMKDAGLTHGGFYAHFASREALLVEAIEHAGKSAVSRFRTNFDARRADGMRPFRAYVETYLDDAFLAHPETGCPVAALCSEMPRQTPEVREASSARVRRMIEVLRQMLPEGFPPEQAALVVGSLIGAMQVARAVGSLEEGRAVLAASRAALIAQYDPQSLA